LGDRKNSTEFPLSSLLERKLQIWAKFDDFAAEFANNTVLASVFVDIWSYLKAAVFFGVHAGQVLATSSSS